MPDKGLSLLGKLFHNAGEGIILFNEGGRIEMLNPKAEKMFGYKEEELLGKLVETLVPQASRKRHADHRFKYMKNPVPRSIGQGLDLSGLRKDGSMFPVEVSLNYLKHENQTIVVAFISDITVRKKNEQMVLEQQCKLEGYMDDLEKKVKVRTSELEHMNIGLHSQIRERKLAEKALKKSLIDLKKAEREMLKSLEREKELGELKSKFVSMASHEFRTPLTIILSSANLIEKYRQSDQQDVRQKHVKRIIMSVQNMTNILNDFLSLEKLESGFVNMMKKSVDMKDLLNEIVDEMKGILKIGQKIILDIESVILDTDEHILKNILINLISNASKYSSENDPIEISIKVMKMNVQISVKDVGLGISKGEQKNLFKSFFRAGNASNIRGTGLGLHIVKKYVNLLDGKIYFCSEEGRGSTFTVNLPISYS